MGEYSKKGGYGGYDKINSKEREKLDYYATPPIEVHNILNQLNLLDLENSLIVDNSCGGGHLLEGLNNFLIQHNIKGGEVIGTDIVDRGWDKTKFTQAKFVDFMRADFLSNDYPIKECDYIIMNPPFSLVLPFMEKSLSIAKKKVIMFGRTKIIEGEKRYNAIFSQFPPHQMFQYVDRVACYKNADFSLRPDSVEAYAWYVWDMEKPVAESTELHWIRRANKTNS